MPISDAMQTALNQQIEQEFYSAYLYRAMSVHCKAANLPGFAHWLRVQSLEETGHALRLVDILTDRGGQVRLQPIPAPPADFASPLELMQQALAHEQHVSTLIHDLYAVAAHEKDYTSETELQWFLAEQVEEEKAVGEIVGQLQLAGEAGTTLVLLDQQLAARSAKPTAAPSPTTD
jgi:ferritin